MVERPFFTIVTITYQNLAGLEETVASVRRQSFRQFEHIVIDGGSTDGTAAWLQTSFNGAWVSEPDDGRYAAMNKGARMARGDYLWFLHAGDCFGDGGVLARVATIMDQGQAWGYGLARVIDPDKALVGVLGFVPFSVFNFAVLGQPLPHQATVMRRDFYERLGGYDERIPVAADQLMMLRAAHEVPPVAMPDFLCEFDSTGISAGRPWWIEFWDAEKNRRKAPGPVTRWRLLDTLLALGYATARQIARSGRVALSGRSEVGPKT